MKLHSALLGLAKGGPEQRAIDAGEIDAVIDYTRSNVFLLPAARQALRELAKGTSAANEAPGAQAKFDNSLLAALPRQEYQQMLGGLEPVTLRPGEVLQQPGAPIQHVYFPLACSIVLLALVGQDRSLQVELIGYEGMLGIPLALGAETSSVRALAQAGGAALRMKAARFQAALRQCPVLQRALCLYAHAELALARQAAACHSFHAIEARLPRWLLEMSARARGEEFCITQAFLAELLGVRRATINEAAGSLQRRGLIAFSRGRIRILDRKRLEAASCSCSRLMSGT